MNTKQLLGRTKRARRNLALKLVLERRFKPELTAYFNKIIKEFRTFYIATGRTIDVNSFSDDTKSLLKKHYLRVSNAFSDEMRVSDVGKSMRYQKQSEEEVAGIVDASLIVYVNQKVPERGVVLDQTTMRDIDDSVIEAQTTLADDGDELTNAAIGVLASSILKRKVDSRKSTINATETQFMSESTKLVEATVVASEGSVDVENVIGALAVSVAVGTKRWASVLEIRS